MNGTTMGHEWDTLVLNTLEALPPDLRPCRREARGAGLAGCALCPAPCHQAGRRTVGRSRYARMAELQEPISGIM